MSYSSEVLADSPLGYWRLSSGARTTDSSGNSKTLTQNGTGITDANGILASDPANGAAKFPGSGDTLSSADASFQFTGTSAFSVELLLNPLDLDGTFRRAIGMSDDGSGTQNGYTVQYHSTAGVYVGRYSSGSVLSRNVKPSSWLNSTIIHIVMTYDGTNITLYLDGAQQGQTADNRSIGAYAGNFGIGAGQFGGTASAGIIDEVAIYGSALSQNRITAHYDASRSGAPIGWLVA